MNDTSFPDLLAGALRAAAARPLVTFYDDATGERVELSVTSYANWVAKTANLLQDELDVGRGATVLVDLPTHWLGPVCLGGAWTVGASVTDDPGSAPTVDLVLTGPRRVRDHAAAVSCPVVALSLSPLGGRLTEPLPTGVADFAELVPAQPDVFAGTDPPAAADPARPGGPPFAALVEQARGLLASGGRLLTDENPCSRAGAATLLAPLLADGGTVWVRHPDPSKWDDHRETERVTAELRRGSPGGDRPGQPGQPRS